MQVYSEFLTQIYIPSFCPQTPKERHHSMKCYKSVFHLGRNFEESKRKKKTRNNLLLQSVLNTKIVSTQSKEKGKKNPRNIIGILNTS